jgi:hypothetical protein
MKFGVVSHGEMDFGNCNLTQWNADGKETKVEVPPVKRTWREFDDYCKQRGLASAGAVC